MNLAVDIRCVECGAKITIHCSSWGCCGHIKHDCTKSHDIPTRDDSRYTSQLSGIVAPSLTLTLE